MAPSAALALEPSGLVLGRYRPLRPLGSGGSGSVWLARDERTGLDLALKIIAREGKAAARAEREVAAAARLRHPACLRAYALERDERHVYIAYEYVPGRTFREALRAGELPDAAAIEACAQVAEALAHAHRGGILHRDVKPSNVLLADGERVSARLLDFGLARMAEAETLTEQGDVPGTLAYISPERLAGESAAAAADVWAVGVMLWEALAGRHPFWQGSMLDTARAIERGAQPLAELRPDLPKQLLQLVDRALSLDPARRPAAAELAEALRGAAAARRRRREASASRSCPGRTASPPPRSPAPSPRARPRGCRSSRPAGRSASRSRPPRSRSRGSGPDSRSRSPCRCCRSGTSRSGSRLLYATVAAAWLALSWREPRAGLLFALGPLLAPVAALGLLPLATTAVRGPARRAATAALAVLAAALAAGIRHAHLPLTGAAAPLGLGVAGADDPLDVAGSLLRAATAQHALLLEAAAFAVVALVLPYARAHGRWGAAGLGALMLVLTLVPAPAAAAPPLVAAAWITAVAAALPGRSAGS